MNIQLYSNVQELHLLYSLSHHIRDIIRSHSISLSYTVDMSYIASCYSFLNQKSTNTMPDINNSNFGNPY